MNSFLSILLFFCLIPIVCCISITISSIFNLCKCIILKKEINLNIFKELIEIYLDKPIIFTIIFILCIFYTLFSSSSFRYAIGYFDLELCAEGNYCFYVELKTETKSYTVPAEIYVYTDTYQDNNDKTQHDRRYYLNHVYWTNGGYLTFEDTEVYINKSTHINATNEKEYKCTLLNKHAYSNKCEETTPDIGNLIKLLFLLFSIIFCWFCFIYTAHKQKN